MMIVGARVAEVGQVQVPVDVYRRGKSNVDSLYLLLTGNGATTKGENAQKRLTSTCHVDTIEII